METLEERRLWSVSLDTNGWTVVAPSNGERIIYVSSSQGSDSNNGLTSSTPIKSFTKAESLLQNNLPNQILLKSGDTFNDSFLNWKWSGADAQDPILISYYGIGNRPVIDTGANDGFQTPSYSNTGDTVNYVDLLGLVFDSNLRDPTLGTVSTSFTGGQTGFSFTANGGNVLIEDCSFSYFRLNFDIEAVGGTTSYTSPSVSNVTIRRTVSYGAYATNGGRSQGLYAYSINGLTITQSDFDHDGWNSNLYLGAEDIGYNHDIYISSTCTNFNASGNVIAEASYAGIMARAGGIIDDNMFIDNPVAVSYGAADGAASDIGGVTGQMVGNTVVGDRASQTIVYNSSTGTYLLTAGLAFGQGFVIANTASATAQVPGVVVEDNIFTQDNQNAKPAIQLEMATGTSNPAQAVGINDLSLIGNIADGWRDGIQTDGRFVAGGTGLYALNDLKVSKNDFINNSTVEVRHDGAFSTAQETWTGDRFYDTVLKQSSWITLQGSTLPFTTWATTYDTGAVALTSLPYTNPNVSVATYDASLGGPGTWQHYLAQASAISIYNYVPQYMAAASVSYIQAGFNVSVTFVNGPGTPPTASAVAAGVNASSLGGPTYTFTVNYVDGASLLTSSFGSKNLLLDGPNGFSEYATYISAGSATYDSGGYQHTTVTYAINTPGGQWAIGADGTYTIDLLPNQITDNAGNVAADAVIGSFNVDFTAPTAIATTPTLSNGAYGFSVTYSDPEAGMDSSTLNSGQVQVTGPGSFSRYATLTGQTANSNGSITGTYTIAGPGGNWSTATSGTYTVSMTANSAYDLAGNAVAAGTLTTFAVGISPVTTASISGIVFNDASGTGVYNSRDNALSGVTVFIDLAGTGVYVPGVDPLAVTTDPNGNYSFANLSAGRYTIIEVPPTGFTVTSPSSGSNVITVTAGQAVTSVNFANQAATGATSGTGTGGTGTGGTGTTGTGTTGTGRTGRGKTGTGSTGKTGVTTTANSTSDSKADKDLHYTSQS